MNCIWLLCGVRDGFPDAASRSLINQAAGLSEQAECCFTLICFGEPPKSVPKGFEQINCLESPVWETVGSQGRRLAAMAMEHRPDIILAASNRWGRSIMSVAAALLGTGLTADCTALHLNHDGLLIQERPAFGGTLLAQIVTPVCRPVMATVRCSETAEVMADTVTPQVKKAVALPAWRGSRILERLPVDADGKDDPAGHSTVIAAGMGVGNREGFDLLRGLARTWGFGFAVTRAAVNAGFAPYSCQVGQSGKMIAPEIYIAIGISGAVQHLAGIHQAGRIIAVNNDPKAQIFDHADVAVVCDWYEFVVSLLRVMSQAG